MRLKIMFALLIFTLVAGQVVYGDSFNVTRPKDQMNVAQYANNALVSDLTFGYDSTDDAVIDIPNTGDLTITISYGLLITNDDDARGDDKADFTLMCRTTGDFTTCAETVATAKISNKGGTGVIEITVLEAHASQDIKVAGVRVDASSLALEDEIVATISSTTSPEDVDLGGSAASGGVSGAVAVVAAGLKVTAVQESSLACSEEKLASITVAEGFAGAWGPKDSGGSGIETQTASVKIVLASLPDGATVTWPASVEHEVDVSTTDTEQFETNGKLTKDDDESSSNGKVVVYNYERVAQYGETGSETDFAGDNLTGVRSFTITPDEVNFGSDASVDIAAMLFPSATLSAEGVKLNLESELSFEAELQNPMDDDGNNTGEGWLVISECVTYLLYPFVTCGATPGWTTGISVSNTSADADIFGAFDEANEQNGSVVMYGFPSEPMLSADDTVEPVVAIVRGNLAAGATVTLDCGDTTMAGMEGYAIIRAGFQHARGMAFVMGNFADGAAVDVSHGYMAEVIDDPKDRSQAIAAPE